MSDSDLASSPPDFDNVQVVRGRDPSCLVISFSGQILTTDEELGRPNRSAEQRFDLNYLIRWIPYSHIQCFDPYGLWYHRGFGPRAPNIESAAEVLRGHIRALSPRTIITIGQSSGGYAALLFGNLLRAHYVHALSAQTTLHSDELSASLPQAGPRVQSRYRELWTHVSSAWEYFDLAEVLATDNGASRYNVHFCRENRADCAAAERLGGLPGVTLFGRECNHHWVLAALHRQRLMRKLLSADHQDQMETALREP